MITIIAASNRAHSASTKLAALVADLLTDQVDEANVETMDLSLSDLPRWNEDFHDHEPAVWDKWLPYSQTLHRSDGFVVVVPEWGGMAPPDLKNLFLLCDGTLEFADKPALLVGVSSTRGGAYPIAELRMSSYKNTRICYIPEQVIVRDVDGLFEDETLVETPEAKRLERQLVHALRLLSRYAAALTLVRTSGVRDFDEFRWGV